MQQLEPIDLEGEVVAREPPSRGRRVWIAVVAAALAAGAFAIARTPRPDPIRTPAAGVDAAPAPVHSDAPYAPPTSDAPYAPAPADARIMQRPMLPR